MQEMTAQDVHHFLDLIDGLGIRIWLDGGWAVDACLGSQTRRHGDLDIVIEEHHVRSAVAALQARGYGPVPRPDTRPWNFVLGDDAGRQIDFHVIVLDEHGRGVYGPSEHAESYPAEALAGVLGPSARSPPLGVRSHGPGDEGPDRPASRNRYSGTLPRAG